MMNRNNMIKAVREHSRYWDFVIVGGGATGLGVAVDAASRGYKTLLLDQSDFAKGTSSRSTKLIHGGVRYLQQGNVALVLEALRERGLLLQNAPHLVRNQSFIVPNYDWWEGPFYGVGLKVYDMLAGKLGFGKSKILSRIKTMELIPTIEPAGLTGGVIYHDGQFDDARLAINLAQTAADNGATLINYMRVTSLIKEGDMTDGIITVDAFSGEEFRINARVVVNATGVFTDDIIRMDDQNAAPIIAPSQGIHLVLDSSFLPGDSAIMVPHTDDGRVLFAVPWNGKVVVGTTDTAIKKPTLEPVALESEVEFILEHAARYLTKNPERKDVLSVFAGLRPLIKAGGDGRPASLSRDHTLLISTSGLVTIAGGKWTTYRKMAEDTVEQAAIIAGLPQKNCVTETLRIHGWLKNVTAGETLAQYGSDRIAIRRIIESDSRLGEKIHPQLDYLKAEVVWATRNEMAATVEDVLSRRTRALLLDARASIECSPEVAKLMAAEAGHNEIWIKDQIIEFKKIASGYVLN